MKYRPILITAVASLGLVSAAPAALAVDESTGGSSTTSTQVTDLERVAAYVQPSVVYLDVKWTGYVHDLFNKRYLKNGHPFVVETQCTGYVVNPNGYIATAGHCVDPKGDIQTLIEQQAAQWAVAHHYYADHTLTVDQILGFHNYRVEGADTTGKGPDRVVTAAWGVSAGGVQSGQSMQARVLKFQPFDKGDGAILKIEATDLAAIELADDSFLEVGTEIVSVGYPASVDSVTDASFTPSFKDGTISSSKTIQDGLLKVYEISAAVSGGMSGGPTVNLDGQVVAFNSFKIDPSLESQPFNFVRPDDIVKELMADVGVANEAGEITDKYRAGLDAYFAGDKAEAVGSLQSVVDQDPTNEFAQTYLAKAKQLPNTDQGFSVDLTGFAALAAMAGVALLLLTVVGGVTAIRRRGNRGGSATIAQPTYPIAGATAYESPVTNTSDASSDLAVAAAPIVTMVATRPSDLVTERRPTETEAEIRMSPVGFCTTCGAQAAPNQRFCGACGSPL